MAAAQATEDHWKGMGLDLTFTMRNININSNLD